MYVYLFVLHMLYSLFFGYVAIKEDRMFVFSFAYARDKLNMKTRSYLPMRQTSQREEELCKKSMI